MMTADNFEAEKNIRASVYTLIVCVLLLIALLVIKWTLATIPPPPEEEGIEVNLGNSDQGLGDDQPFLPGKPAPSNQEAYVPPKASNTPVEEAKDFETDDKDEEAPVVKKPPVVKPNATKVPEKEIVKAPAVKNPLPTSPPAPTPPKPKAVFKGVSGTGTGGNEADSYKKGGNQGIAGGRGDQGAPGGNPDSDNYTGGGSGSGSGVAIKTGLSGRRITRIPSFEDDFNENARIAVDIRVDAAGNVTSAEYQPRGSTSSDPNLKAIAIRKAKQIKFNPGDAESSGTLQFNFRLKS